MRKIAVPTLLVALAAMQLVRVERVAAGDPEEARVANEVETPKSVQPRTLAPGEELAVTFSRTDGQRLEFTNLDELRSTPGASVSASMDSLTLFVPVDDDGRVSFDAWFKSGAIEVGGKTFDEAGQAIHDGVLGPHDRDFTVAVDFRPLAAAPPKLAAAAAPKPRKAKRAAKPLAAAEGEPARQVEFQMQFVKDATGALADFEFPGRGGGMTVGESRAVLSALRVFHKHKLTSTESYPVIRTEMGRPASFSVGEPVKGTGAEEGADFRIVRAVTIVAHSQDRYGADDGLFVEMQGRAEGRKLKTAMHMQIGQTAIIQIPPADGDLPAHYIVVTPRWVE